MGALSGIDKPLVAMVHLPPLPGAANYDGRPVSDIARQAAGEARTLAEAGFHGVMLQNTHDRPARLRARAGTIAAMGAIASAVAGPPPAGGGVKPPQNDPEAALPVPGPRGGRFVGR